VIVPSRGRPNSVPKLAETFANTTQDPNTKLWIAVDSNDPDIGRYQHAVSKFDTKLWTIQTTVLEVIGGYMSAALNEAAWKAASDPTVEAIGFMGDDHRPRTPGWDTTYLTALREMKVGIVYGDDGLQSEALPTQCAMSAGIVRALGWMCPPTLRHLWIDNFWLDLGKGAECLRYLPDVFIEHMHPYNDKAEMDAGYERVNSLEMIFSDRAAYERYATEDLARDVEKIGALRG
jgi:hypothetical protein